MINKQIASTIFINSFQKEIRNKTFWVLLVSSILVMLAGRAFFKEISVQMGSTMSIHQFDLYFYYFIIFVWSFLVITLLGINCIKSDTRYGLAEQIVAFPIRSESYLFLRITATAMMSWFFYLILFIMMLLFLIGTTPYPVSWKVIGAVFIFFGSIIAMTTLASFWSLLLGQISGFIALTLSILVIIYVNKNIGNFQVLFIPGFIIHWLFPHIAILNQICSDLIFEPKISDSIKLWLEIPHFFLSTGFLFWFTHFIFKKRGFK